MALGKLVSGERAAHATATFLVVTALFVPQLIGGLYGGLQRDLPVAVPVLCTVFLVLSLIGWFSLYSRKQRLPWVMDMGWFLFAAWMIVIPYYIMKTEGRSGIARIGLFCLTWFAAWATGWAALVWVRIMVGGE